eukprot:scaffold115362_cov37-Prasinocladus_malaysianus.AAC.1
MQATSNGQGHLCRQLAYTDCATGAFHYLQAAKDHVFILPPYFESFPGVRTEVRVDTPYVLVL